MTGITHGSIPMSAEEAAAIDEIASHHQVIGVTRRDPGETGPLLVDTDDGTFTVDTSEEI